MALVAPPSPYVNDILLRKTICKWAPGWLGLFDYAHPCTSMSHHVNHPMPPGLTDLRDVNLEFSCPKGTWLTAPSNLPLFFLLQSSSTASLKKPSYSYFQVQWSKTFKVNPGKILWSILAFSSRSTFWVPPGSMSLKHSSTWQVNDKSQRGLSGVAILLTYLPSQQSSWMPKSILQAIILQPAVYASLQLPGTISLGNSGDLHNTSKRPQLPPSRHVNIK